MCSVGEDVVQNLDNKAEESIDIDKHEENFQYLKTKKNVLPIICTSNEMLHTSMICKHLPHSLIFLYCQSESSVTFKYLSDILLMLYSSAETS